MIIKTCIFGVRLIHIQLHLISLVGKQYTHKKMAGLHVIWKKWITPEHNSMLENPKSDI